MKKSDIPHCVHEAKFAARGEMLMIADAMSEELKKPESDPTKKRYPFQRNNILRCNVGNPQAVGMKPFTFLRQVLAFSCCPQLLENPSFRSQVKPDVIKRVKWVIEQTGGHGVGSYTHSAGCFGFRQAIADFFTERDRAGARGANCKNVAAIPPVAANSIIMTNGATSAIDFLLTLCLGDTRVKHGIMVSSPNYPIYNCYATLHEAYSIPYEMDEENGWNFGAKELQKSYDSARQKGITPMVIELIAPGNPTGAVLSREKKKEILQWCIDVDIAVIADEVYYDNVYEEGAVFHSFREVLYTEFPPEVAHKCRLISVSGASKSTGECCLRSGCYQTENLEPEVFAELFKLASAALSPNSIGQIAMTLAVTPPKPGDASYELDQAEKNAFKNSLRARAKLLTEKFNRIPGIVCQKVSGAFYAFPRMFLPSGFKHEAKEKGRLPDQHFCILLLEQYGVLTVPGSGFGDRAGTYHFRTTILPPIEELDYMVNSVGKLMNSITSKHGSAMSSSSKL